MDNSTGLMYYRARYYAQGIGRFISADTVVPDPSSSRDFNRYAYGANNPLAFLDPDGHQQRPVCGAVLCASGTTGGYVSASGVNLAVTTGLPQGQPLTIAATDGEFTTASTPAPGLAYAITIGQEQRLYVRGEMGSHVELPGGDFEMRAVVETNILTGKSKTSYETNLAVGAKLGNVGLAVEASNLGSDTSTADISVGAGPFVGQVSTNSVAVGMGGSFPLAGPTMHGYLGFDISDQKRYILSAAKLDALGGPEGLVNRFGGRNGQILNIESAVSFDSPQGCFGGLEYLKSKYWRDPITEMIK